MFSKNLTYVVLSKMVSEIEKVFSRLKLYVLVFIFMGISSPQLSAHASTKNNYSTLSNFVNQTLRNKKSCRDFFKGQMIGKQVLIPANHVFSNPELGIKKLNIVANNDCTTRLICNLEIILDVGSNPGEKITLQSPLQVVLMPDHKTIKDCMCSFTNYTYCEK